MFKVELNHRTLPKLASGVRVTFSAPDAKKPQVKTWGFLCLFVPIFKPPFLRNISALNQ